jgi:hypothetical protein
MKRPKETQSENSLDIFYFAFGITRRIIKQVNPSFRQYLYSGITWKH